MKTMLRILLALIVLGAAGATVWYYYLAPKPFVPPQTAAVTRGDIELSVLATGTLTAQSVVSVGAEVSGRVVALHVSLGQTIKEGDPIAEIDPLDRQNAVKLATAALANIEAQKRIQLANERQAEVAANRAGQLRKQNLMSDADYQTAQLALETAKAQIDVFDAQISQAQLNVDSANLNLSRTRITAPMDGTVVAVPIEVGQTVNASQAAPTIVKLANLSTMIVRTGISEADVPNVTPGQRVYFTILGDPGHPIEARLLFVEPAPDAFQTAAADAAATSSSSAVYYNGVLSVPNPDGKLRISMTAQVTIVLKDAKGALLVPASALGRRGRDGKYSVTVYDPQTMTSSERFVTVGINNKVMAEITDGLSEGEQVVANTGAGGSAGGRPNGGFGGGRTGGGLFGGRG